MKKLFLKISLNLHKKTCARVLFNKAADLKPVHPKLFSQNILVSLMNVFQRKSVVKSVFSRFAGLQHY